MAREPEKSGQESGQDAGKSKSETTSVPRGTSASGTPGASGKSAASKEGQSDSTKAGESGSMEAAGQTTLPELHSERRREMQSALGKRSGSDANPHEIVREFATIWLPHQVAVMEVLVPALDEEEVSDEKRSAAIVRKDIVNLLLTDLLGSEDEDDAPAKLEALADALDAFVTAAEAELDELMEGADEQSTARLGQRMRARHERAKRRFSDIDQNVAEARELLALRSLSVPASRRRGGGTAYAGGSGREDYGRFASEYERSRGSGGRERDEGSFTGRGLRSYGRYEEGEDVGRGYGGGRSMGQERGESGRAFDRFSSQGQRRGQGGFFGDREGQAEESRRHSRGGQGAGGWFGDPAGHSQAARRGWEEGYRLQRRGDDEDSGNGGRSRDAQDDDGGRYRSRSSGEDDDNRRGEYGAGRGGRGSYDDDRSHTRGGRGWSGDHEGHAEAARRGWDHRRG